MKYLFYILLMLVTFSCTFAQKTQKPNIVIIYVDDLGYGDLSCYGAKGVQTPNVDLMAQNGLKFTDAHCSAATCTPSRYSLLTGSYAFRNDAKILEGDAPLLIRPGSPTLPQMLKDAGYATGVVGKWHLGLGNGYLDWNKAIKPGPLEVGFTYSFLIPATGDRVPSVFVENHEVVGLSPEDDPIQVSYDGPVGNDPTGISNPELLKYGADRQHAKTIVNGISRIGYMSGGQSARWKDEDFPYILTQKAKKFMEGNQKKPFFLFFSLHDIHVPRLPHENFTGKSQMGYRGDAIVQMDWCAGEIIKYLKDLGLSENTLVIFSSDNGPVLGDGYDDQAEELIGDHKPAGPFRGGKYSTFEAGTRVPTITYWPGKIKPAKSNALWSQVDIYASIAKLIQHDLGDTEAPDSFDMSAVMLGESKKGRTWMVEEASTYAIREGKWKYIKPGKRGTPFLKNKNIETGFSKGDQLYNLSKDVGETQNLAEKKSKIVDRLRAKIDEIFSAKGSRPQFKME